jgi:hypothetical protein
MRRIVALLLISAACGTPAPAVGDGGTDSDGTNSGSGSGSDAPADDDDAPPTSSAAATGSDAADDTGAQDDTSAQSSSTSGGDTGSGFVHEVHTLLTRDGRLALQSNLPRGVDDCLALEGDPPCDDADIDGLVDAWEDAALDRLRPMRRFDEVETVVTDAAAVMADVGRVAPGPSDAELRLYVMLGYSRDYGSCGLTSHNGDSERVALALAPWREGGPGGVVMAQAYTAAHEGSTNDHGRVFAQEELGVLVFAPDPDTGEPRWVVFPSADKHATYATVEICEGISQVPCFDEDCGPDGVADPSLFDALPIAANAGEEGAPRLTDLAEVGFPGEDAWAEQDFCGGLGGSGCSSAVREKLLVDPF